MRGTATCVALAVTLFLAGCCCDPPAPPSAEGVRVEVTNVGSSAPIAAGTDGVILLDPSTDYEVTAKALGGGGGFLDYFEITDFVWQTSDTDVATRPAIVTETGKASVIRLRSGTEDKSSKTGCVSATLKDQGVSGVALVKVQPKPAATTAPAE